MSGASEIFRSLGDPTRLRIIALLRAMELSVGELAQVLGQSQPRVSRHVKILIDAGLAERRKEGSWVFLSLADAARTEPLFALLDRWADRKSTRLNSSHGHTSYAVLCFSKTTASCRLQCSRQS